MSIDSRWLGGKSARRATKIATMTPPAACFAEGAAIADTRLLSNAARASRCVGGSLSIRHGPVSSGSVVPRVGDALNPRFVFSSGQRRAAGLAFLLSVYLARPWSRMRTLVLDDPVQHIDDSRALHFAKVLTAMRRTGRQVVCTIEDESLADLLCRRLRALDSEGGVKITMGYESGKGGRVIRTERITPHAPRILVAG